MSRIILSCASLFDGQCGQLRPGVNLSVSEGRIELISDSPIQPQPQDICIDVAGKTLMPGLIDAHFHCNSPSFDIPAVDSMYPSQLAQHARHHLEDALMRGFTTVRDAGGADRGLVQAVDNGLIKGPRLLIAGKALSQTGGHGDMRSGEIQEPCGCAYQGALSEVVDGADEMRKAAREQLRQGADQIKLFVSGGVLSPTDPIWMDQFSDLEIQAAVEEAKTRRSYVMAHAHTAHAVYRCVKNGVRSIEHGTMTDQKTAEYVAGQGAFIVPTLAVINGLLSGPVALKTAYKEKMKAVADQAYQAVEFCQQAGVKLGLGTDLFGPLHDMQMQELVIRSQLTSTADVLRSATSVNAQLIKKEGQLGVVKKGAIADLIVVDGDPLADITVLSDSVNTIELVMKEGELFKNKLSTNRCTL